MKFDRTKYTAHYENGVVVAQWISIETSLDSSMGESPLDALDKSQELVQQWYKSKNLPFQSMPPGPPHELPVINKAEERIEILIDDATCLNDLEDLKKDCTTVKLKTVYEWKHRFLSGAH